MTFWVTVSSMEVPWESYLWRWVFSCLYQQTALTSRLYWKPTCLLTVFWLLVCLTESLSKQLYVQKTLTRWEGSISCSSSWVFVNNAKSSSLAHQIAPGNQMYHCPSCRRTCFLIRQPDLVVGNLVHSKGVGAQWSLKSLPNLSHSMVPQQQSL